MLNTKFPWWKLILGYLFFILFHQIYDLTGGNLIGVIFGEGIEAVYPHMKMLFYSYLLITLIDYFVRRRQGAVSSNFVYARMLILASVPWMMIAMYYSPQALLGMRLSDQIELIWALIMTAIGIYFCIRLEAPFEAMPLKSAAKAMIVLAFLGALITYTGFSFHVPDNFFLVTR